MIFPVSFCFSLSLSIRLWLSFPFNIFSAFIFFLWVFQSPIIRWRLKKKKKKKDLCIFHFYYSTEGHHLFIDDAISTKEKQKSTPFLKLEYKRWWHKLFTVILRFEALPFQFHHIVNNYNTIKVCCIHCYQSQQLQHQQISECRMFNVCERIESTKPILIQFAFLFLWTEYNSKCYW